MANRKKKPTRVCWEFLERVRKACKNTPARGLAIAASSSDVTHAVALEARGWIAKVDGRPYQYAITFAGEEALKQQKQKIKG